jgi:hypothetical protein
MGNEPANDAFGDQRIGVEGQMRAVLFMGAERQDGDPVAALTSGGREFGNIVIPTPLGDEAQCHHDLNA